MTDKQPTHRDSLKGILGQDGKTTQPPKKEGGSRRRRRLVRQHSAICGESATRQVRLEFRFRDGQQHLVPLRLDRPLAVQPVRRTAAQIQRRFRSTSFWSKAFNLDMPQDEGTLNLDHRRPSTTPGHVDWGDERRRHQERRRNRSDHRQHSGCGV